MKEITYHKLVRDNIPDIIKKDNKEAIIYIASNEETKEKLFNKLIEELNEFKETPNKEELADLLEVIEGMANLFNIDMEGVLLEKQKKKEERGGFSRRIILEKVIEKP